LLSLDNNHTQSTKTADFIVRSRLAFRDQFGRFPAAANLDLHANLPVRSPESQAISTSSVFGDAVNGSKLFRTAWATHSPLLISPKSQVEGSAHTQALQRCEPWATKSCQPLLGIGVYPRRPSLDP